MVGAACPPAGRTPVGAVVDGGAGEVTHLAAAMSVSVRTVHAVVAETGPGPATVMRSAQIERVERLLAESRLAIGDIADAAGSSDATTTARAFARSCDMTPAEYPHSSRGALPHLRPEQLVWSHT